MFCRRKPVWSLFFYLIFGLVICGCNRDAALQSQLLSFKACKIAFPEKVLVVENGCAAMREMPDYHPFSLVYFLGYKDCFECEIGHLHNLVPVFQKAEADKRFQPIVIFAPEAEEIEHTLRDLKHSVFPYPIYVSLNDEWAKASGIPEDSRFHTFLLDENGHPLLVGDPFASTRMMKLFNKTLSKKTIR